MKFEGPPKNGAPTRVRLVGKQVGGFSAYPTNLSLERGFS